MPWARRRYRVRMHLKTGPSIEGLLLGPREGHYHLAMAKLVVGEDASHDVGEVMVPKGEVLFYQRLGE